MALGSVVDARLQKEIEQLERLFTIDTEKLKKITDHFVNELERGELHPITKTNHAC